MGVEDNVAHDRFPRQGSWLHRAVRVCFNYDPRYQVAGRIVRDDTEESGLLIIALADGRYVLSTECMYKFVTEESS